MNQNLSERKKEEMATMYTIYPLTKGDYVVFDVNGAEYRISGQLLASLNREFPEAPAQHDDVNVHRVLPGRREDQTCGNISTYGNERPIKEEGEIYRFRVAYEGDRQETLELPSHVVHALVYATR
jgi:hypothetical protein